MTNTLRLRLRRTLAALAVLGGLAAGTLGLGSAKAGTLFTLDSLSISARNVDPGLVVSTAPAIALPGSATLDVGVPLTVDLFHIWTSEGAINNDDRTAYPIVLDLTFTDPSPGFGSGGLGGTTVGGSLLGFQGGSLSWDAPFYDIVFGNGGLLRVALSDETFNVGFLGTLPGKKFGATVEATFTLVSESVPVPEPATLALFGAGLLGLGLARRRRA